MLRQTAESVAQGSGLTIYSQNLREVDSALWQVVAEQSTRDDLHGIVKLSNQSQEIVASLSDAVIEQLTSGVCASFRIAGLDEKSMISSLNHHYCPYSVVSRMSERPPDGPAGGRMETVASRVRRSMVTISLEVASSLARTLPPASLSIKTGLPELFCSQLRNVTLSQIKRFAWMVADDVYFEPRFPERLLEIIYENPDEDVCEQKMNFCFCEGLVG